MRTRRAQVCFAGHLVCWHRGLGLRIHAAFMLRPRTGSHCATYNVVSCHRTDFPDAGRTRGAALAFHCAALSRGPLAVEIHSTPSCKKVQTSGPHMVTDLLSAFPGAGGTRGAALAVHFHDDCQALSLDKALLGGPIVSSNGPVDQHPGSQELQEFILKFLHTGDSFSIDIANQLAADNALQLSAQSTHVCPPDFLKPTEAPTTCVVLHPICLSTQARAVPISRTATLRRGKGRGQGVPSTPDVGSTAVPA